MVTGITVTNGKVTRKIKEGVSALTLLSTTTMLFGEGTLEDPEGFVVTPEQAGILTTGQYIWTATAERTEPSGELTQLGRDYVVRVVTMPAPASLDSKTEQQAQDAQGTTTPLVQNWRPPGEPAAVGMPPPLEHEVFGKCMDDFNGITFKPKEADLAATMALCNETSVFYAREAGLEMALHKVLQTYMVPYKIFKISPTGDARSQTVGAIVDRFSSPDKARWMIVLFEVKEDMGLAGDANYQGAAYHGKFYSFRRAEVIFKHTFCPTLLVEQVGPHIRVSALSWASRMSVVPLTPLLHTLPLLHEPQHLLAVARLLGALRRAVPPLSRWYSATWKKLRKTDTGSPDRQTEVLRGFPYPLRENYSSIRPLVRDKYIYAAVPLKKKLPDPEGRPVVVKFCLSYGQEVHEAWAQRGLALRLLRCQRLPGGWWWVEMELLDPQDGWLMLEQVPAGERPAACAAAAAQLAIAHQPWVQTLTGKKPKTKLLVHGDMRPDANVLYRRATGSEHGWEAQIVDFERAREQGVTRYPPFMNHGISWPEGVAYGQPLMQAHDVQLLAAGSCSPGAQDSDAEGEEDEAADEGGAVQYEEPEAATTTPDDASVPEAVVAGQEAGPDPDMRPSRQRLRRRTQANACQQLQPKGQPPLLPPSRPPPLLHPSRPPQLLPPSRSVHLARPGPARTPLSYRFRVL